MADVVLAYVVMAYVVMAYAVMSYVVMALNPPRGRHGYCAGTDVPIPKTAASSRERSDGDILVIITIMLP